MTRHSDDETREGMLAEPSSLGGALRLHLEAKGRAEIESALAASGGMWRNDDVLQHLQVGRATLLTLIRDRKILALPLPDGAPGYPVAQFAPPESEMMPYRLYPVVADILESVRGRLSPEEIFLLLATPQDALSEDDSMNWPSGFQCIALGQSALVRALFDHVTSGSDDGVPLDASVVRPDNVPLPAFLDSLPSDAEGAAEAGRLFAVFTAVADRWSLDVDERCALMGNVALSTFDQWIDGSFWTSFSADQRMRIALVVAIDLELHRFYGLHSQNARTHLRRPHTHPEGAGTALEAMLAGPAYEGLKLVLAHVEALNGGT